MKLESQPGLHESLSQKQTGQGEGLVSSQAETPQWIPVTHMVEGKH